MTQAHRPAILAEINDTVAHHRFLTNGETKMPTKKYTREQMVLAASQIVEWIEALDERDAACVEVLQFIASKGV